MDILYFKISDIKPNPKNPRTIRDDKFQKLVDSIKDFPQMLSYRPIVVNEDNIILGGNMRFQACKHAGLKKIPVVKVTHLTPEQESEFIIKDNANFGTWDWDILANIFEPEDLKRYGLNVWQPSEAFDDDKEFDLDFEEKYSEKSSESKPTDIDILSKKKVIVVEFDISDYPVVYQLIKDLSKLNIDLGSILVQALKEEKEKLV